jgi:hypothetical protein
MDFWMKKMELFQIVVQYGIGVRLNMNNMWGGNHT